MVLTQSLGTAFDALPQRLQEFHGDGGRFRGWADITVGRGLARLLCRIAGFPPAGRCVPLTMTIRREADGEDWCRAFGPHALHSQTRLHADGVSERFGPFDVIMRPQVQNKQLHMPVTGLRCAGLPVPTALIRGSGGCEWITDHGTIGFDVASYAWGLGLLIRYTGELAPDAPQPISHPDPWARAV